MFLVLVAVAVAVVALGHPAGSVIAEHRRRRTPPPRENLPLNLLVITVSLGLGLGVLAAIPGLITAIVGALTFDPANGEPLKFVMAPWALQVFWGGVILGVAIAAGGILSALAARSAADPRRQRRVVT